MKHSSLTLRKPGDAMAGPIARPADFSQNSNAKPTPWMAREIRRRKKILRKFDALTAGGMSRTKAAKQLRQSLVTIWRWEQRINPNVQKSGRKPLFTKAQVPASVVARVQRLQLAGISNSKAWRAVAGGKICAPALNEFLRTARNIPPSFLSETRLVRETIKVIRGTNFTLQQPAQ